MPAHPGRVDVLRGEIDASQRALRAERDAIAERLRARERELATWKGSLACRAARTAYRIVNQSRALFAAAARVFRRK